MGVVSVARRLATASSIARAAEPRALATGTDRWTVNEAPGDDGSTIKPGLPEPELSVPVATLAVLGTRCSALLRGEPPRGRLLWTAPPAMPASPTRHCRKCAGASPPSSC